MKVLVIFLLNMWMKRNMKFFKNMNIKVKFNFLSNNELKFQHRT